MEDVGSSVAGKIVDLVFGAVKREIDYVRKCTKNVDELRDEVKKLSEMRGRIQQRIDVAQRNGERLLDGVQNWMDKAYSEISMVEEFLEEEENVKKTCFNLRVCVNLGTLHHYGKMAINKIPVLLKQQEDGKTHESCVSIPTPAPGLVDLYQTKNLDHIDTQKSALGEIIEAIKDENIHMVGIYGIGGVGKTTLATEVAVKVKDLFKGTVIVTVSQTVNIENIKEKVEKSAKRIVNGDKVLIILDGIWKEIDLAEVGIPYGEEHKNCKILLTSRSINVCEAMNAHRNICVNTLTEEEAWVLFKRIVGEKLAYNNVRLEKVAREVTEECGGLPLLIQAVGKALKNKEIHIWEAALGRLRNHSPPAEIIPDISMAFTRLKLSYDLLESKEAKSCFLLCSMFQEDEILSVQCLAEYGVGLGIFDNLDSIKDAKERVTIAFDTLTSSGLLLSEELKYLKVINHKMHDVVRDVALLITSSSSEGEEKFLVKAGKDLTEWQPRKGTLDMITKISLMHNSIGKLPDQQPDFPRLDTFLISCNDILIIPDEFFKGMKEVKVLDMSANEITSIPQSLKLLTKLITIDLSYNRSLDEISLLGELKDLEILKVRGTRIKVIPEEIGQLTNLRLLDAGECKYLSGVTPGVISKLSCLEELYIGTLQSDTVSNIGLTEICKLKWFRVLHLYTRSDIDHPFPEGTYLERLPEFFFHFRNRKRFVNDNSKSYLKRQLCIGISNFTFTMPIKKLFRVSDGIDLKCIDNLKNIIPDLYGDSIDELKYIELSKCKNVSCLVKTRTSDEDATTKKKFFSQVEKIRLSQLDNLKLLFDCSFQYISLGNLREIIITDCNSLLTLFPLSVAQGLSNLRRIQIYSCYSLMVVISAGGDKETTGSEIEQTEEDSETEVGIYDKADIVLPSLADISLYDLTQVTSFYSGDSIVKYPSLESIKVENCPNMKTWGYRVPDMPNLKSCDEETLNLFH